MATAIIGALTAANALSGGRIFKAAKKNVGKFIGKLGKKGADILLSENSRKKLNKWIEDKADVVEKVIGDDSEITRNLKNFSKEMKGENTEWRRYDDQDDSDQRKEVSMYDPESTSPYIRNLGGTNYKRYVPRLKGPHKLPGGLKRLEIQPHSKFNTYR